MGKECYRCAGRGKTECRECGGVGVLSCCDCGGSGVSVVSSAVHRSERNLAVCGGEVWMEVAREAVRMFKEGGSIKRVSRDLRIAHQTARSMKHAWAAAKVAGEVWPVRPRDYGRVKFAASAGRVFDIGKAVTDEVIGTPAEEAAKARLVARYGERPWRGFRREVKAYMVEREMEIVGLGGGEIEAYGEGAWLAGRAPQAIASAPQEGGVGG